VSLSPFRFTVKASGYKDWHYGGERWQTDAGLIKLPPGGELDLKIRLQPVPKK